MEVKMKELLGVFETDAGTLCAWDALSFDGVVDAESWELVFGNDAAYQLRIEAGQVFPIGLDRAFDGAFAVLLRAAEGGESCELSEREREYLIARSQGYRFVSTGSILVGGVEHVGVPEEEGAAAGMQLAPGCYRAEVCVVAWGDEPGMRLADGRPAEGALPDFVVLLNPASDNSDFRKAIFPLDPLS
jgi:hypothetical protein